MTNERICKYCGKPFELKDYRDTNRRPRQHCEKVGCRQAHKAEQTRKARERMRKHREKTAKKERLLPEQPKLGPTRACLKCGKQFHPEPGRRFTCEFCFVWNTNIQDVYADASAAIANTENDIVFTQEMAARLLR